MVSVLKSTREARGYVLIIIASILWGTMGILEKLSFEHGILPETLIALRLLISFATLSLVLASFDKDSFKIQISANQQSTSARIRLYIEDGLNLDKISEHFGLSSRTQLLHVQKHNRAIERGEFCPTCRRPKASLKMILFIRSEVCS